MLGLLPLLLLVFAIFRLRGCWQIGYFGPSGDCKENNINQLSLTDKKQDIKEVMAKEPVIDRQIDVNNGTKNNAKYTVETNGVPISTDVLVDALNTVDSNVIPNNIENNGGINQVSNTLSNKNDKVGNLYLAKPDKKVDNLTLSPAQVTQRSTNFLNGQWSVSGGIQDKATGKPLQLSYEFKNRNGQVTVTRSDGVKCLGQVDSGIQNANLSIVGNNQAICSDNTKYQLPKIQCKLGNNNQADCQGIYDNGALFPITMKKQ